MQNITDRYAIYNADCVETLAQMPAESIHYSVFSPPFASLFTYSDHIKDMGNCRNHAEFFEQYAHLAEQLYRVLKPGRLVSVHCMNLPTSKVRDGFIGISDFRGQLIQAIIRSAAFRALRSDRSRALRYSGERRTDPETGRDCPVWELEAAP